jgi:hypothetical protein
VTTLRYRPGVSVEALQLDECTIRGTSGRGARWWMLWFVFRRIDGRIEHAAVPVLPHGAYTENGPGGRTWGFRRAGPGAWQVSPSIDAQEADPHAPPRQPPVMRSVWHQTPLVVGVPEGQPWM